MTAIVIDNGSYSVKAGIAGDFVPEVVVPSTVSRFNVDSNHTKIYAGNRISRMPTSNQVTRLFTEGAKMDWKGIEQLYRDIICDELKFDQDSKRKHKLLLTQHPDLNPKIRNQFTQMIFESFDSCDGLYFATTTSLALYAHGLTTGLVVDSGYNHTYVAPVFEGYTMPLFIKKLQYGGNAVTKLLQTLLNSQSKTNNIEITEEIAEHIKKNYAYAAMDYFDEGVEYTEDNNKHYRLPDGQTITLGKERFESVEVVLQPHTSNIKDDPLPYCMHQAINQCDHSLQKTLFASVVLCGGNTMISGLKQRVLKDLVHVAPASLKVKVHANPQRGHATWTGGSLLADQSEMKNIWITKADYEEMGADALTVRCF